MDLPAGVSIVRTEDAGWDCQPKQQRLTCTLPNFPIGQAPVISVTVTPALGATTMTFNVSLSAPTTDLDQTNNTASVTVNNPTPLVARPAGGGLSCSMTRAVSGAASGGLSCLGLLLLALGVLRRRLGAA